MADIELVIKIPEDYYEALRKTDLMISGQRSGKTLMSVIYGAVAKGTPLPNGHGELIDRKDLIENGTSKGFCDWYDEIKMADTIIEADRGEVDGK